MSDCQCHTSCIFLLDLFQINSLCHYILYSSYANGSLNDLCHLEIFYIVSDSVLPNKLFAYSTFHVTNMHL